VYNIGNNQPAQLMRLVELMQKAMGAEVEIRQAAIQPGDVETIFANITAIKPGPRL